MVEKKKAHKKKLLQLLWQKELKEAGLSLGESIFNFLDTFVFDPLTGLLTRNSLPKIEEYFSCDRKLQENFYIDSKVLSVGAILLDIDHFKSINDTFGHLAGDFVLQKFAEVIDNYLDQLMEDYPYFFLRWGGEEFLILFPVFIVEDVRRLAEEIVRKVRTTKFIYQENENEIPVTVSAGCMAYSPRESLQIIFLKLDSALYFSKKHGRDRVTSENDFYWEGIVEDILGERVVLVKGNYPEDFSPLEIFSFQDKKTLQYRFDFPPKGYGKLKYKLEKDYFLLEITEEDKSWKISKGDLVFKKQAKKYSQLPGWEKLESFRGESGWIHFTKSGDIFLSQEELKERQILGAFYSEKWEEWELLVVLLQDHLIKDISFNSNKVSIYDLCLYLLQKGYFDLLGDILEIFPKKCEVNKENYIDIEDFSLAYFKALYFWFKEKKEEANKFFEIFLEKEEVTEKQFYNYAIFLVNSLQWKKLEECLKVWADKFPKDSKYYFLSLFLSLQKEKEDELEDNLLRINDVYLRLVSWYNVAEYYRKRGEEDKFREYYKKAIAAYPLFKLWDDKSEIINFIF